MRINTLPNWAATALLSGPIFGSEGEEGGATTTETKPAETATTETKKTTEENADPQLTPEQIAKLVRENNEAKTQLSAFQQEKEEREAAEEEARRATASKEENLTKDVKRLEEENEKLRTVNERNILDLAILRNSKYEWHNADNVAKLIDRSGIKIDTTTGVAEGIEDALKDLAKDQPHLLKSKQNSQGNSGTQTGAAITGGNASGGVPVGNRDTSAGANKRKQLEDRFPALRV